MEILEFNSPFPHIEVKNFLPEEVYLEIKNWAKNIEIGEENTTRITLKSPHSQDYNVSWLDTVVGYFKELVLNQDINVDDFNINIEFRTIGKGFNFCIHQDIPSKYYSFVLGVSDEGEGTRLYKENNYDSLTKEVNWIPNGGVAFKRSEESWHSYGNNICEKRDTLLFNLFKK